VTQPLLVVVAGPPGSGTTTLAHELARAIPCPAICRDEIKEGLVHGIPDYEPAPGDAEAHRTLEIFFGVVGYLVDAGVSLVAEAAFQHALWERSLAPLLDRARVRVVHCQTDPEVAWERIERRSAGRGEARDPWSLGAAAGLRAGPDSGAVDRGRYDRRV
jgi:predicted kinase